MNSAECSNEEPEQELNLGGGEDGEKESEKSFPKTQEHDHNQNVWESSYYPEATWQAIDEYGYWMSAMSEEEKDEPQWKIVESPKLKKKNEKKEEKKKEQKKKKKKKKKKKRKRKKEKKK